MSEYWVSHKKYFCRYCEIYIADDVPSRQQHENGLRHKGNTERFIRSLYKTGEKRKKDLEDEKREMTRVEQAAQIAFAQDVSSGLAKSAPTRSSPAVPPTSAAPAPKKPLPKPTNPYANYSTAEFLGYKDPDAERVQAELERRRTQGVAGDWEIVHTDSSVPSTSSSSTADAGPNLKRESDVVVDDEDSRQFKLRKKTLGGGLGEIYDPGIIPIKLKKKKQEDQEEEKPVEAGGEAPTTTGEAKSAPALKWTKVKWKRAGDDVQQGPEGDDRRFTAGEDDAEGKRAGGDVKQEPEGNNRGLPDDADKKVAMVPPGEAVESDILLSPPPHSEQNNNQVKLEEIPSVPPAPEGSESLFRKRRAPAGTTRGKRQV